MCLSCQYLPPADEVNLQLALSVTANCVRIYMCVCVGGRVWARLVGGNTTRHTLCRQIVGKLIDIFIIQFARQAKAKQANRRKHKMPICFHNIRCRLPSPIADCQWCCGRFVVVVAAAVAGGSKLNKLLIMYRK